MPQATPDVPERLTLDLRGTPCPLNFVRAKLRLEKLPPGQWLDLWLDAGEPIEQVPSSLAAEGYDVGTPQPQGDAYQLSVRRSAP